MVEQRARWLWYERTWFVIAALIVFWPIGLALMWAQHKFSPAVRLALSVAAPALSAAVLAGIILLPRHATPTVAPPAPVADITTGTLPASSTVTTGSSAASSTTSTKTPTSGKKTTGTGKKTSGGTGSTPRPTPTPPAPPAPKPTGAVVFTVTGTYSGTHVTYSLSASGISGASEYDWFVTANGDSHNPSDGQSVSFSYEGQPPTSVRLEVLATDGHSIRQSFAAVTASKGKLTATGY
jgi:hypothetical protein